MNATDALVVLNGASGSSRESGPLAPNGIRITNNGAPWVGVFLTAYTIIPDRTTNPSGYAAVKAYCQRRGLKGIRALGMYNGGIGTWTEAATNTSEWFRAIHLCAVDLAASGLRLDLPILADCENIPGMADTAAQQNAVNWASSALTGLWNAEANFGNEAPKNGYDPQALTKPANATPLFSRGSNLGDDPPPINPFARAELHGSRSTGDDDSFETKYGHDAQLNRIGGNAIGVPFPNCCMTYSESMPMGGDGNLDPWKAAQMAATARMFGVDWVTILARTPETQLAVPADGSPEDLCIDAIVKAHALMPGQFALGAYSRGDDSGSVNLAVAHQDRWTKTGENPAGAARTYVLTLPGGTAIAHAISPGAKWPGFVAQNGARILSLLTLPAAPSGMPPTVALLA